MPTLLAFWDGCSEVPLILRNPTRVASLPESLRLVVEWLGSQQPVPLAHPISSFEGHCPCLVAFPTEPNLRLWMSAQAKCPCPGGPASRRA